MKIERGTVVFEQCGFPGNVGDSCAESARYNNLCAKLKLPPPCDLSLFFTNELGGLIRHPSLENYRDEKGNSWAEDDFSSDQGLPLLIACKNQVSAWHLIPKIKERIAFTNYHTGNGDIVNAPFLAELKDWNWLTTACVWGQARLFSLPFRWNEAKNKFEENEESSADYLNFFHLGLEAPQAVRRLVPMEKLFNKILDYYEPEPNSKTLLDLYHAALIQLW